MWFIPQERLVVIIIERLVEILSDRVRAVRPLLRARAACRQLNDCAGRSVKTDSRTTALQRRHRPCSDRDLGEPTVQTN